MVAALIMVAALAGCASDAPSPGTTAPVETSTGIPAQTGPASPEPTVAGSHTFQTAPTDVPNEFGEMPEDITLPTTDPDRSQAVARAVHVMKLFCQRHLKREEWFAQLEPYLTEQAAIDFSYTQPYKVRFTKVIDEGKVVPTDSAWLARIHVNTDSGIYLVVVTRTTPDRQWRVARIIPPEYEVRS
jgi:hypothetical protein